MTAPSRAAPSRLSTLAVWVIALVGDASARPGLPETDGPGRRPQRLAAASILAAGEHRGGHGSKDPVPWSFFPELAAESDLDVVCKSDCNGRDFEGDACEGVQRTLCRARLPAFDGEVAVIGNHSCDGSFRRNTTLDLGVFLANVSCYGEMQRQTAIEFVDSAQRQGVLSRMNCSRRYELSLSVRGGPVHVHIEGRCEGESNDLFDSGGSISGGPLVEGPWMGGVDALRADALAGAGERRPQQAGEGDAQDEAYPLQSVVTTCNGSAIPPEEPCQGWYERSQKAGSVLVEQVCAGALTPVNGEKTAGTASMCVGQQTTNASVSRNEFVLTLEGTCASQELLQVVGIEGGTSFYLQTSRACVGNSTSVLDYLQTNDHVGVVTA